MHQCVKWLLRHLNQKPTSIQADKAAPDPILGLMRDDADLMDEIVANAYRH